MTKQNDCFKLFQIIIKGLSDRFLEHILMLIFLKERTSKFKITWAENYNKRQEFLKSLPIFIRIRKIYLKKAKNF